MTDRTLRVVVGLVGLCLFLPFLGSVHLFDWDEVNFAECAREMIVSGDYLHVQIDYRPFFEKPPLFIWLQVLSMKVFGVNEFAARLPNALLAALTMPLLLHLGALVRSRRLGLLWAAAYAGSILPNFYGHSGIIDPLFNLCIFGGIWQMVRATDGRSSWLRASVLAGCCTGLAVLTKGPVGWGLVGLTTAVVWLVERRSMPLPWRQVLVMSGCAMLATATWYGIDLIMHGPAFLQENLAYQLRLLTTGDAGHEQPFYYHPVVVLLGCYPASIFFLKGLGSGLPAAPAERRTAIWMLALFGVVMVVFSLVRTKIVHYSSMTYLPLTFIAAMVLDDVLQRRQRLAWPWLVALAIPCLLVTVIGVGLPLAGMNIDALLALPTFRDVFLRAAVQQPVAWSWVDMLPALLLPGGYVAFLIMRNRRPSVATGLLFGSVALFILTFLPLVAPKIERYTQGAAIDVYTSLRGKDVYVKPLTMKSYAHLFYTDKPPRLSGAARGIDEHAWEPWLLEGDVDRPVVLVARVNDAEPWRHDPRLRERYARGGFVIFERRDQRP